MKKPLAAVGSLGGTIAMTKGDGDVVRPTLSADDLLAAIPGLGDIARCTTNTITTKPGASLAAADLRDALAWARGAVDAGADGVVLTQGTDTIEETAYLLDLYWERDAPLVVTGAMRHAAAAGADGPGNVTAAVTVAVSRQSRSRGVLVVLNDTVHAGARVQKGRSSGPAAFVSPSFGALGQVEEGVVHFQGPPSRWPTLTGPEPALQPGVAIVQPHLGDDGALLDHLLAAGYAGVVLSTFGVGHVPETVADAVTRVIGRMPVVFAAGSGSGPTYRRTYGFAGSESDLIARGAIGAGWLDAKKARLLLAELIAVGVDRDVIARTFGERGAAHPTSVGTLGTPNEGSGNQE